MCTLRFLLVTRAGRLIRIGGRHVLRLSHNPATEALYAEIDHRLAHAIVHQRYWKCDARTALASAVQMGGGETGR